MKSKAGAPRRREEVEEPPAGCPLLAECPLPCPPRSHPDLIPPPLLFSIILYFYPPSSSPLFPFMLIPHPSLHPPLFLSFYAKKKLF